MKNNSLEDIQVTNIKRIQTKGGDVMTALKSAATSYIGFGEAYFSCIEPDAVKAWKCHLKMTLNLVVPIGNVKFVFFANSKDNDYRVEEVGEIRYVRLTVPPGIWFGFMGVDSNNSIILNLANMEHDEGEVLRMPKDSINYKWSDS